MTQNINPLEETFAGFEPANTTPVPDILFDVLLTELSGSQLKVMLYIIRRTLGFKKQTDAISLNQFHKGITTKESKQLDKGCGVSDKKMIVDALAYLEKHGYIVSEKNKTSSGDSATTVYKIHFCAQKVVGKTNYPPSEGSGKNQLPLVGKTNYGSGKTRPGVVGKPDPQETVIQLDSLQETVIQEGTYSADLHSQDQRVPHPFHDFIFLNDSLAPSEMIVLLTSQQYSSEIEDKRRASIAEEVKAYLARRGYTVSYRWEHEAEPTFAPAVVDAHHQGSEHSPEIVHAPSFSTDPNAKGDVSPTQDSGFLPSVQSENAPHPSIPSNEPPTISQAISASSQSENEPLSTNEQNKQPSYSREDAHDTTQTSPSRQKPRARKPAEKPSPPAKPTITLSPGAQSVYDEWCKLPWFKVAPELTANLAAHCETAKAYGTQNTTLEVMLKVKNWATSKENDRNGFYKGKGWNMKFFLNELPKWLSVQPEQKNEQSQSASNDISDIERRQLINFFVDHPEQIEMAAEEYPDLVKIAKAELEKIVLARGA